MFRSSRVRVASPSSPSDGAQHSLSVRTPGLSLPHPSLCMYVHMSHPLRKSLFWDTMWRDKSLFWDRKYFIAFNLQPPPDTLSFLPSSLLSPCRHHHTLSTPSILHPLPPSIALSLDLSHSICLLSSLQIFQLFCTYHSSDLGESGYQSCSSWCYQPPQWSTGHSQVELLKQINI